MRLVLEVIRQEVWEARNEFITTFKVVSHIGPETHITIYTGTSRYEPGKWVVFDRGKQEVVDKPPRA